MSDILDEVVRERSDEQKLVYFKKALPIIATVTVLVIIAMMVNDYLGTRAIKHNVEIGDTLIKSLENIRSEPQLTFEGLDYVINNAKNNEKDIASLQLLAIHVASKNLDQAFMFAHKIAEDKKYLDLTRAYAKLTWISIITENKEISEDQNIILNKYFDSFSENTPFFGSASLLKAIWYKDKDSKISASVLQKLLSSEMVSPVVKEEARALISNLKSQNK